MNKNSFAKFVGLLAGVSLVFITQNFEAQSAFAAPNSSIEMMESLTVAEEAAPETYNRSLFNHWVDANKNGCDTRAEVLISESRKKVTRKGKCTIVSGEWLSAYDNTVIKVA